ncbi:MAG: hypothetical protein ACYDFT_01920 [Thermoplasmata archaeon]
MPFELASLLLSGPDLGGGFLFQLTREGTSGRFTFHLQDAGTDAAGEPPGSPELLGYAHPAEACMYGGPGCWQRSFLLPESAQLRVRAAYNRTRFVIGPMLQQAGGRAPTPIAEGMRETLGLIAGPLAEASIPWLLAGSAVAWVRGVPRSQPRELLVITTPDGVRRLGELLEAYLVEPVHPVGSEGPQPPLEEAAAFVGTFAHGLRVEWTARPDARHGLPAGWSNSEWSARRQKATWESFEVPLAPLELELLRTVRPGGTETIDGLLDHMARTGWDPELLDELLATSELDPEVTGRIRARLR